MHSSSKLQSTTYHQNRSKVKAKVLLEKLLREHCTTISKKWGKDCTQWEGKKVQHNKVVRAE
jgi:hypothetical protein